MNKLIIVEHVKNFVPIYENNFKEKVINARELHKFLGSNTNFTTWIQRRIIDYKYIENEDYISFSNFEKRANTNGLGTTTKEYILKLDTAKEIAMLESNEQGRNIRKYFIEVEKKWNSINKQFVPKDYEEALEELLKTVKLKKLLELNNPIKGNDEIKAIEVAELLGYYTIKKEKPYSQFIGAVIKQLDNTNNGIYRNTEVDVFNKAKPNEIIYIKREAITEIADYINNFTYTTKNNIRTYIINNKIYNLIKK